MSEPGHRIPSGPNGRGVADKRAKVICGLMEPLEQYVTLSNPPFHPLRETPRTDTNRCIILFNHVDACCNLKFDIHQTTISSLLLRLWTWMIEEGKDPGPGIACLRAPCRAWEPQRERKGAGVELSTWQTSFPELRT